MGRNPQVLITSKTRLRLRGPSLGSRRALSKFGLLVLLESSADVGIGVVAILGNVRAVAVGIEVLIDHPVAVVVDAIVDLSMAGTLSAVA